MDVLAFAQSWIDDWNSHDLERVIGHYTADAEFRSPLAKQRTGDGVIRGHEALRAYWSSAFALRPALHFELKAAFSGHNAISIHYSDELGRDIVETLVFGDDGKAVLGMACYSI
ncbi:MAG: nuclear transport factor 2 family protein [Erythrobacter sp.]|nr:nuclear transport factor 2 family protein [Erythrobacter sp.]